MTIPGLPDWAKPDSYPPPPPATPVLALERARELARVPPGRPYGQDWDWERFMGTALMPGVPVTLPGGRIAMPHAGGGIDVLGGPAPAPPSFDPPPGVQIIQGQPDGTLVVSPLPPGIGGDDAGQVNTALLQCVTDRLMPDGTTVQGGRVRLAAGIFNTKTTITSSAVAPVWLEGGGAGVTVIAFTGSGDAVSMSNAYKPSGGSLNIKVWGGGVSGMTIDGTGHAAGQSSGLHIGDLKYGRVSNVQIQHFNQAGDIGLWVDNRNYFTEDCFFEAHCIDSTTLFQIDATGSLGAGTAGTAHDNCWYLFSCAAQPNQDALHITHGANLYHSRIWLHGGMKSSASAVTAAALRIDDGGSVPHSSANRCEIVIQMESDAGLAFTPQTIVTGVAGNTINSAWGRIAFTNAYSAASLAGPFMFNGPVSGDATLSAQIPSGVPANGVPTTNNLCPAIMTVTGGTVTAIKIAGVTTGAIAGPFYVAANQTYEIDYTVAPTVAWSSAVPG